MGGAGGGRYLVLLWCEEMGNIVLWFGGPNVGGKSAVLPCGYHSDFVME